MSTLLTAAKNLAFGSDQFGVECRGTEVSGGAELTT
jgi:hypothetical protein